MKILSEKLDYNIEASLCFRITKILVLLLAKGNIILAAHYFTYQITIQAI